MAFRVVLSVALVALASVASVAHAASCASTGAEAPTVTTLVASSDDPAVALIVSRDCSVRRATVTIEQYIDDSTVINQDVGFLRDFSSDVERVDSLPARTNYFVAKNTRLTRGADLSKTPKLWFVTFTSNGFSTLDAIKLPASVLELSIENSGITSLRSFNWPASLARLSLKGSKLTAVDPSVPFPATLQSIDISSTAVSALRGFKLPASLQSIDVTGLNIRYVEVRQSDVAVFSRLGGLSGLSTQSSCDAQAKAQQIGGMRVCVVSDARFDELYSGSGGNNGVNTPPSGGGDSGGGGGGGGDSGGDGGDGGGGGTSGSSTGNAKPKTTKPNKVSNNNTSAGSTTGTTDTAASGSTSTSLVSANRTKKVTAETTEGASGSLDLGGSTGIDGETRGSKGSRRTSSPRAPTTPNGSSDASSSSSKSLWMAIGLILGALGAVTVVVAIRRRLVTSPAPKPDSETLTDSTKLTQLTKSTNHNDSLLDTNDLLHDQALFPFHIEWKNIRMGDLIARGGYGDVYRGVYNGRSVAIKQIVHQDAVDVAAEIRMCARLDHPRIVEFIGITWSDRRAVSMVFELMKGGDLYGHLTSQSGASPRDWSHAWTTSSLKSKAAIAQDVAEAVVYLHSFQTPILHRDLKARNVLLSNTGDAKLSDFGISREAAIDETMTREVGTAAWIAPEVLRGKRYNEKADIYSFGVLLVEMDTGRHPFSKLLNVKGGGEMAEDRTRASSTIAALQNAQLIVSIGNGELRPTASDTCPDEIKSVADACLSLDAESRPTAMEVYYRLRQFTRRQDI